MKTTSPYTNAHSVKCVDCIDSLTRLISNVRGFVYRRRYDARWTMDFVSDGCRNVIGYDPHRFLANGSIAFADLIARSDWERVNESIRRAVLRRKRTTVEYLIRVAHGALVLVEDRLTPVIDIAGEVVAIEGVIDRARTSHAAPHIPVLASPDASRFLPMLFRN